MIDFSTSFTKMSNADLGEAAALLDGTLLDGETIHAAFKGANNYWTVFTDRRLITVIAQGITGKKREYSTLPYSSLRATSVTTDAKMGLWFAGLGFGILGGMSMPYRLHLEFVPDVDVRALERFIVGKIL